MMTLPHGNDTDDKKRLRIGEYLLLSGMINQKMLDHALALQKKQKKKLGQILMEIGAIDDVIIAQALAKQFRIPYVRLKSITVSPQILSMVPFDLAQENLLIPIQIKNDSLVIAMANPTERSIIDTLKSIVPLHLEICVAPEGDISEFLSEHYPKATPSNV